MTKNFDFIGKRKFSFTFSIALIVIILAFTVFRGVKLDIEFKGGTFVNYSYSGELDIDKFANTAKDVIGVKTSVTKGQDFTTGLDTVKLSFTTENGLTADKQFELTHKLEEDFSDNNIELLNSQDVSPSSGTEFFLKCLVAVIFASIILILYISLRFKKISGWSAGLFAVLALFHDVFMVYGTFVIFGIPINANFMAVVLTILGYSINDTIVIYDRIRENKKVLGKKTDVTELVNLSLNQCFTRSIYTTVTTISAMLVVSIVAVIYNVSSILTFSVPMIVGMVFGCYSTIFITCPLWVMWQKHKESKKPYNK